MKKIILFDIDYTLFNTDLFRDLTYPQLRNILEQEDTPQYHAVIKEVERSLIKEGGYEPVAFATLLSEVLKIPAKRNEIEQLFYSKELYEQCLYPDVTFVIQQLSKSEDVQLGIVSKGEQTFQKRKIEALRLYFIEKNIFISEDKNSEIQKMKDAYRNNQAIIIDDSQVFLHEVQETWDQAYTVLMERENRYERRVDVKDFVPEATIHALDEVLPLVDKVMVQ